MKKNNILLLFLCITLFSCATNRNNSVTEQNLSFYSFTDHSLLFSGYADNSDSSIEDAKNNGCFFIQDSIKNSLYSYISENGLDEQEELYAFIEQISFRTTKALYNKYQIVKSEQLKKTEWLSQINILKTDIKDCFWKILSEDTSFEASAFSEFNPEKFFLPEE
jgi:hypothetical protein